MMASIKCLELAGKVH